MNSVLLIYIIIISLVVWNLLHFLKYINKFNKKEIFSFSYLLFALFGWILCNFFADIIKIKLYAEISAKLAIFFFSNFFYALYNSLKLFPQIISSISEDNKAKTKTTTLDLIAYVFITLSILLFNSPINISNFKVNINKASEFNIGALYIVAFILGLFYMCISYLEWRKKRNFFSALQKKQVTYLQYSIIIIIISISTGFIILPLIGLTSYTPFSFLGLILFTYTLKISILSKDLLIDIDRVRNYSLIFIINSLTIIVFLNLITVITKDINDRLTFLMIIIISYYLIRYIDNISKKNLEKDNFKEYITSFSDQISTYTSKKKLIKAFKNILVKFIKKDTIKYIEKNITEEHKQLFVKNSSIIVNRELIVNNFYLNNDVFMKNAYMNMVRNKIGALIFIADDNVKLHCVFEIKENNLILTEYKRDIIRTLAQTLSSSISKVKYYTEIKRFNLLLNQKVKERTYQLEEANRKIRESQHYLQMAYNELKQLDDAKSNFISMASHQLRTPISIIRGYSSMLQDGDFGPMTETQKYYIGKINDNLARLNTIVNDILNASRIEGNRFQVNKQPTDLSAIVKKAYEGLHTNAEYKGLKYSLEISPEAVGVKVNIDADKFYEVISNIVDNAINYTEKGGVTVALIKTEDGTLKLSVKDSGIGIPADKKDEIFKRFSRLENAKQLRPDGTGIGLYLAKTVVDAHKGRIWFESEEGKGTTFFIELNVIDKDIIG